LIRVRDAVPADGERVAAMVRGLTAGEHKPPATFTAADFERDGFGARPRFHCLVAEVGRAVLGYATWYPAYDMSSATHGLHLLDLFVEEAGRGRGCGTALIRALGRRAADGGGKWICFHTRPDNPRALALYRRLGAEDLGLLFLAFDLPLRPVGAG
jgi:ribosomal protein S18 acetylase RimI-like enzyme